MDRIELLVHVAAPGTIHDDRRYRAIAQGICDFELATMNRLNLGVTFDDDEMDTQTPVRSPTSISRVAETPAKRPPWAARPVPTTNSQSSIQSARRTEQLRAAESRQRCGSAGTSKMNPPYRNPFHGVSRAGTVTAREQAKGSPEAQRPRTAPGSLTTQVQVPFTDQAVRKRAYSESFTATSFTSVVQDSQPPPLSVPVSPTIRDSFTDRATAFEFKDVRGEPHLDHSTANNQRQIPPYKKRRLDPVLEDDSKSGDTDESEAIEINKAYFLRDRSLDWTSQPSAPSNSVQSNSSIASTLSPSQPILPTFFRGQAVQSQTPVDISSPDLGSGSPLRMQTMRMSSSPFYKSPPEDLREKPMSSFQATGIFNSSLISQSFPGLLELSAAINCPVPPTSHKIFTTHISPGLESVAVSLPLSRYFRPQSVSRDIKVLERGYWRLDITVAAEIEVAKARKSPAKEKSLARRDQQLAGSSVTERLREWEASREADAIDTGMSSTQLQRTSGLWSEGEFMQFWKNLTSYITGGKAGWGVRAVMDVDEDYNFSSSRGETVDLRVKVFTWGEVVGHMWLLMWVLSDKAVSYVPMEWVAGDERLIVRMTGDRYRAGSLGSWTKKGGVAEKGAWGIKTE